MSAINIQDINIIGRDTVIPRLTRFLWQPKNRVRRKSSYASQKCNFYKYQSIVKTQLWKYNNSENTMWFLVKKNPKKK